MSSAVNILSFCGCHRRAAWEWLTNLQYEESKAYIENEMDTFFLLLMCYWFFVLFSSHLSCVIPHLLSHFINFMLLCSFRSAPFFITPHLSLSLPPTRALYDRVGEAEGDLSFKKDDILYVDESLPKGIFGTWMAWQLDENAQQIQRGQIPSKYMWVETANTQYISIITIHKQFVHHHSYLHCCRHIYSCCEYNIDSFPFFFNNNKNLKKK